MIQRHEILEAFREFIGEKVPEVMGAYGTDHDRIVGKVFTIIRDSMILGTEEVDTRHEFVFPIAKVWLVGDKWEGPKVKVGEYVRLRDIDAMTQYNPRYEVWIKNEYTKGNMDEHRVGSTPPKVLQNLWINFGQRMFNPDPFDVYGDGWLSDVFFFDTGNVVTGVKNTDVLFKTKKI